jgi:predicted transposase YbfD/YdcC
VTACGEPWGLPRCQALPPTPEPKSLGILITQGSFAWCRASSRSGSCEAAPETAAAALRLRRQGRGPSPGCPGRARRAAARLDGLLTAIAVDGKWLRGVADGQVKLFAALLHEDKTVIAQHRIPDDTNEITQVRELLDPMDLTGTVITADAAHAQHHTAAYIAGERGADYLLTVKGKQPGLQRAIYGKISAECGAGPDRTVMDYGHGRILRRSIWVTSADGVDFPHAAQVMRIRRDTCDLDGTAIAKEIVHGITSLDAVGGTPAILAGPTRGQWGIESVHWIRDTAYAKDASTGYAGNGPQVMATLRNIAISLLHLAGISAVF